MDTQCASLLLTYLPGEIRNRIYKLVLKADYPITDPAISLDSDVVTIPSLHHFLPKIGVPIIRTCRFVYDETTLRPLFAQNTFRFTLYIRAHHFLTALPKEYATMIRDIEVDLRNVSDAHPLVAQQWVQYLSWAEEPREGTAQKKASSALRIDAPGLNTLRLNIEGWSRSESLKSVALIQDLLKSLRNLERVVVTGADGSAMLSGAKAKYLQQWGPVIFVGVMRFARLAGMMAWMADCVRGESERKVVRWSQEGRVVCLEVMSWEFFVKETGSNRLDFENGEDMSDCCSLLEYEERWQYRKWPILSNT